MTHLIEVLGPGCAKCDLLARYAEQAADELGLEYQLFQRHEPMAMLRYGVLASPALVVDGRVVLQGQVQSPAKLKALLG